MYYQIKNFVAIEDEIKNRGREPRSLVMTNEEINQIVTTLNTNKDLPLSEQNLIATMDKLEATLPQYHEGRTGETSSTPR